MLHAVGMYDAHLAVIHRLCVHRKRIHFGRVRWCIQCDSLLPVQDHQNVLVRIVVQRCPARLHSHPKVNLGHRFVLQAIRSKLTQQATVISIAAARHRRRIKTGNTLQAEILHDAWQTRLGARRIRFHHCNRTLGQVELKLVHRLQPVRLLPESCLIIVDEIAKFELNALPSRLVAVVAAT
jgi:hypothetical protein